MRNVVLVLVAFAAISTTSAVPAAARDFPYCIKGCDYGGGAGDCSFSSYQQCQATAAGRLAYCASNPYFSARAELPAERGRSRRPAN